MIYNFIIYWNSLWDTIPIWLHWVGLGILIVSSFIAGLLYGKQKGLRFGLWLFFEYVLMILCSTVLLRKTTGESHYDFVPFWSYKSYLRGEDNRLLIENIMNVVVFIPFGLLASMAFRFINWKKVLIIGLCLSIGIEILQFLFKKGFSELDDVMHNTLGV